jgi:hypothetical protein
MNPSVCTQAHLFSSCDHYLAAHLIETEFDRARFTHVSACNNKTVQVLDSLLEHDFVDYHREICFESRIEQSFSLVKHVICVTLHEPHMSASVCPSVSTARHRRYYSCSLSIHSIQLWLCTYSYLVPTFRHLRQRKPLAQKSTAQVQIDSFQGWMLGCSSLRALWRDGKEGFDYSLTRQVDARACRYSRQWC